ncbi:hypothetical protein [Kosakonia sp. R1.Fl]|uniref:hypothetical protein n=1 Tax=Kosakonia sp. R1.Fl TaxID=2928706 RepID=UPI00201D3353|nr:hypothetical protein [Kosakonia sp. R1.Fl]MCL6743808.1 hypothetical protein [Kosakonia sp. R1.Fl]
MNYNINITDGYPALLNLDNTSGLYSYFAIDPCGETNKIVVSVENLEINADKDLWCSHAIAENPKGVIAKFADRYDGEDSVASFLLRRAKIVAEGDVTYCVCLDNGIEKIYHTLPVSFSTGSKYVWLSGKSLDYTDSNIGLYIFFSGRLSLQFDDRDVLLQMQDFKSTFNMDEVKIINKSQEIFNKQRDTSIKHDVFNNTKSPFFNFDFLMRYFEHTEYVNIALRDFHGDLN